MNELIIVLFGREDQRIYYKTNQSTRDAALDEFDAICKYNNIDIDNIIISDYILRDENGEDID